MDRGALRNGTSPRPSGLDLTRIGGMWRVTRPWHPGLRPYLLSYAGYREAVPTPFRVLMMPTGRANLVIQLAEPFTGVDRLGVPGGRSGRIGSLVVGLEDRPALCVHPGGQEVIRLEFTPLGAYRLLGMPMRELANRVVELDDVLGREAAELVGRLAATPDWSARFDLLDHALLTRLDRGPEPAPEVRHAWRLLAGSAGTIPVARIADEVGWSHGHLVRRFTEQVGLPPKTSARVLRFQRALRLLARGNASLAEISAACGFFDQAHLNREFRTLADTSPLRLAAMRPSEGGFHAEAPRSPRTIPGGQFFPSRA
jgi:AraC-like DNA-binding protein